MEPYRIPIFNAKTKEDKPARELGERQSVEAG